jgi:hypothetical protein
LKWFDDDTFSKISGLLFLVPPKTAQRSGAEQRTNNSMASLEQLLSQLEESKRTFGAGEEARTERLLTLLGQRRFRDVDLLIRFHEALLFICSHPQSPKALRLAHANLSTFVKRVQGLQSSGLDLTPFDYIEYSGIAGTAISGTFSYDIARFLIDRYPGCVEANWSAGYKPERLGATLPRFLPLLYEDSLVEANIPYLTWLHSAKIPATGDLEWLVRQFERLKLTERQKAELFDSLEIRITWKLGNSRASRTLNNRPVQRVFYHTKPLIRRGDVSLDEEFQSGPLELERLSRADGLEMQHMLRETTTVRYRELYGITHGDPGSVVRATPGRGIEIFLWGLPPERRLPLRAYHAGFTLKNGIPINYIEGITICDRMEIGFNTFYTFREGESAWVYSQVLKLLYQVVGVTCISIDPYQLGFNNEEAIESGAFWFYRKLGFRPVRPDLARLMLAEEKKMAVDRKHRTPAGVLRRLSAGNVVYEAPGSQSGDWDRFAIRNVGLAVAQRMAREYAGDVERIRTMSVLEATRALNLRPESLNRLERRGFDELALVLAGIEGLAQWTGSEKKGVIQIIRAKMSNEEAHYAHLLQQHERLRAAIIKLGETEKT